ncbi:hypothetical protein M433DRAFT_149142 [Acidomyces richmondensis BFW]|nr:MAG: hypothetical protein FE78DRAFT_87519 [Acidomyces sp. 'richmondensis']KYG50248.1 hypothetical protein M433DRAFT_149142 [Acidomyces richmondensis BFW]
MLSAVGENRLMPKPELDCMLINAKSGYGRKNYSWVLSRMLRDFDYWRPAVCNRIEEEKLDELRRRIDEARQVHSYNVARGVPSKEPPETENIRIGLRVTVWECKSATGRGSGDLIYYAGFLVTGLQLGIAAIPWGVWGEWFTFLVTAAGTVLAYLSGSLKQWQDEKIGVRKLKYTDKVKEQKDVLLTEGNGAHDVILILCCNGGMDLEALAGPQRDLPHAWSTRVCSLILATCWIALLVSVAGWDEHTWFILGVGMIGILHNVGVAGMKRQPKAFGIDLLYRETIVDMKVMDVLRLVEEGYPKAGAALLEEFFPGKLLPREKLFWDYCARRAKAWSNDALTLKNNARDTAWPMPPLQRPDGQENDQDIPDAGPYKPCSHGIAPSPVESAKGVISVAQPNVTDYTSHEAA